MKTKIKILASAAVMLAVLLAFTLTAAAESAKPQAEGREIESIHMDFGAIDSGATLVSDKTPALKEGSFALWIDRVDFTGAEYAEELYDWLVENSDGDGEQDALIEPTEGEAADGKYVYKINVTAELDTYPTDEIYENMKIVSAYANAAYDAFDRDHPEVFWLSGMRKISSSIMVKGDEYTQYFYLVLQAEETTDSESFDIRATDAYPSAAAIRSAIAERDAAVDTIIDGMTATDAEGKIKYFNAWLTKNNCYNSGDLNNLGHDARECMGAFLGKTGTSAPVCEAYARAFKVLCDKAGIPCVIESGLAFTSLSEYSNFIKTGTGGELHMWNIVKISGLWFGVDVTWNDPTVSGVTDKISGYENENYILVGSETKKGMLGFSQSHYITNTASDTGFSFTNGPVMSAERYVSGYVCPHDFSSANNICSLCGEVALFEVSGAGNATYYTTAEEAFYDSRIVSSMQAQEVTLKLLADVGKKGEALMITTGAKFTLELNGKTLYGAFDIVAGGEMIIKDSAGGGYISGAGSTQAAEVSGGKLWLCCAVNGVRFERGALELCAGAACGSSGLTIDGGNVLSVSGAPAEKIIIIKEGAGVFAEPTDGVSINPDWFEVKGSGKKIVSEESGKALVVKLALPAFTFAEAGATYDGKAHKPTVLLAGLTENADYTVSYTRGGKETANFVGAGELTVTVTGIGDYIGEVQKTFVIAKAMLTAENFEIILEDNIYDGKEKRLAIRADINGTGVAKYKLGGAYAAPISAGVYEVYMTVEESANHLAANSLYIGTFEILAREITVTPENAAAVQNGKPGGLQFTVGGAGLAEGHRAEVEFAEADTSELGEAPLNIAKVTLKNAAGADVSESYKVTLGVGKITVTAHEHKWGYEAAGAEIKAVCGGEGPCTQKGGSIEIKVPTAPVYDGRAHKALLEGALDGVDTSLLTVTYTDKNGTAVKEPTEAGEYTACVAFGGLTAKVQYKIEYLKAEAEAEQETTDEGTFIKAPAGYMISRNAENGWSDSIKTEEGESTVTYYLRNSAGQITDAKTLTLDSSEGSVTAVIIIASVSAVVIVAIAVIIVVIVKRKNTYMYW